VQIWARSYRGGAQVPEMNKQTSIFDLFPELLEIQEDQLASCRCEKPTLMIAMTPRTGSTHLCASLGRAADIDSPAELFNPRGVAQHEKKRRGVSLFSEYIKSVSEDRGPYLSFKISWLDFNPFAGIYKRIFPNIKIIYLNRLDIVAQAVSLVLATSSGRWHETADSGIITGPGNDQSQPGFDLTRICDAITRLENEKNSWESFFFSEFINPARINYESFSADVNTAIRFITRHLDLSLVREIDPGAGFRKLSDKINDDWIAKVNYHRSGRFYADWKKREEVERRKHESIALT
jgi:LPS sulfotransferase NodH